MKEKGKEFIIKSEFQYILAGFGFAGKHDAVKCLHLLIMHEFGLKAVRRSQGMLYKNRK